MCGLFSVMIIEMTRHVRHVPLIFLYLYARALKSNQKQIVEYDIKSRYPKEYSMVHKVGSENRLAKKSCFV